MSTKKKQQKKNRNGQAICQGCGTRSNDILRTWQLKEWVGF